jgi:ATP-dependent DNA helicase RecG
LDREPSHALGRKRASGARRGPEAKSQWAQDSLCEYAVAIANERGGRLVLGVTNHARRKVVGTGAFRDLNAIRMKVFQALNFRIEIDELEHTEGRVLVIHIPSRPIGTPLHYNGKFLMRVGESLVPMSADQLRTIFNEGRPDFLSEPASEAMPAADAIGLLDTQTYYELQERRYPESRDEILAALLWQRASDELSEHVDGIASVFPKPAGESSRMIAA